MIDQLVSDLPEIYQPIYGHPELSGQVSRSYADRLEHIARVHDALQRLLDRPLSVLDLGCTQGFFSLNLAERGAIVHGVDFLDKNIAVCEALALEHPTLQVRFEIGRVEDIIAALEPGQYDLVLGLSVFHHIVHEKSASAVKTMLEQLAAQSGTLLVELALREEPLYWAHAQPENPYMLLDSIAFVHEIARHSTHLAPILRPLFVASNRYWILEDKADQFDSWSFEPHALAHGTHHSSRRYFFSSNSILKFYRFDHLRGEYNKAEFTKELCFLQQPPPEFPAPSLIASSESESVAWLAIERLPGKLLLDLLNDGVAIDSHAVLVSVLQQLAVLETAGLYHNDVRTWNVLVAEDSTTHLIDYGSISSQAQDCVWPGNLFFSFFIFVREVTTGVIDDPNPLRTVAISPSRLPQPYRAWAQAMWRRPLAEWSFKLLHQTLLAAPTEVNEDSLGQPDVAWMKAIEEAIQAQKLFVKHVLHETQANRNEFQQTLSALVESHNRELALCNVALQRLGEQEQPAITAENRATEQEQRAITAENRAAEQEQRAITAETKVQQAETQMIQVQQENQNLHRALAEVHSSLSIRITAPLRWAGTQARRLQAEGPKARSTAFIKKLFRKATGFVTARPRLKRLVIWVAQRLGLTPRLRRMYWSATLNHLPANAASSDQTLPTELSALTPRARQIYADLKTAIERNKGGLG